MHTPRPLRRVALLAFLLALSLAFFLFAGEGVGAWTARHGAALGAGSLWLLAAAFAARPLLRYLHRRRRFRVAIAAG